LLVSGSCLAPGLHPGSPEWVMDDVVAHQERLG
jgi:hypothetical protein